MEQLGGNLSRSFVVEFRAELATTGKQISLAIHSPSQVKFFCLSVSEYGGKTSQYLFYLSKFFRDEVQ